MSLFRMSMELRRPRLLTHTAVPRLLRSNSPGTATAVLLPLLSKMNMVHLPPLLYPVARCPSSRRRRSVPRCQEKNVLRFLARFQSRFGIFT